MSVESIVQALNGPFLVKLVLAAVLLAAFLFLQRKETEGVLPAYVVLAAFAGLRDLAFAVFPDPLFYRVTDLVLLAILAWAFVAPLRRGFLLVGGVLLSLAGAAFLGVFGLLSPSGFTREPLLALLGLPSIALIAFAELRLPGAEGGGSPAAEGQARSLARRGRLPLAVGSVIYLGLDIGLGPGSVLFQTLAVPLYYGLLFSIGFFFVDILRDELVRAVDYYEESIDSLYDLLLSSGAAMSADFSLQDILDSLARVLAEKTGADGAALLLVDEEEEYLSARAVFGRYPPPFKLPESLPREESGVAAHFRHLHFSLKEGLFGEVASGGNPLFIADARADSRIARNGDEPWLRIRSLIAVPLIVRDRIFGIVSVARSGGEQFSERDFDRAKLLSNFGSIVLANSYTFLEAAERGDIEREAAIAADVQRTIVPKKIQDIAGISFGAWTEAARGVCSDYYDVVRTGPDRAIAVIGDVAGKGVAASLVMVMIRSILHLITASAKDAATLVSWVNRGISGKVDMDHYATLGLLRIDAATGEVEYANAAHQPVLVYRRDADAVETVDIKSIPIGVERSTQYAAKRLRLRQGDVLVLYTDGVVEAMNENGKQFGRKNLGSVVMRSRDLGAREIADTIREDLREYCGRARRHDDQTVLVLKAR